MTHPNAHTVQQRPRVRAVTIEWTVADGLRPVTACALVIVLAAAGMAQLGIPSLPIMWPLYRLGLVAPTCGLTRGVVALARTDFADAWSWNPASYLIGFAVTAVAFRFGAGVWTKRWLHMRLRLTWRLTTAVIVLLVALWLRQQANADLLMSSR